MEACEVATAEATDSSLNRLGVDRRDKPGHDDEWPMRTRKQRQRRTQEFMTYGPQTRFDVFGDEAEDHCWDPGRSYASLPAVDIRKYCVI
jgi:hypothetical protein